MHEGNEITYFYANNRLLAEKRKKPANNFKLGDCLYENEVYYLYTDKTDISYMYNANELTGFVLVKNGLSETGLYYLRSRYYDVTTGRFINQDAIEILDETKKGYV